MTAWKDKEEFKNRVREWAEKLGVEVKTISIRRMKNKWASYSQHNDLLIFDEELLDMDREVGDYVIVHELLHFRVPNHGKLWKSLMYAYLGDFDLIELRLKEHNSQKIMK